MVFSLPLDNLTNARDELIMPGIKALATWVAADRISRGVAIERALSDSAEIFRISQRSVRRWLKDIESFDYIYRPPRATRDTMGAR